MNVTRALVWGLSGSHAIGPVFMRLASCRYPVCIRRCLFDLSYEWSTTGHELEFPRREPHAHSVIVQRKFCPLLIWYIFVLSIIHPVYVR